MPELILKVGDRVFDQWQQEITEHLPDYKVHRWSQNVNRDSVRYACVWQPESGELRRFSGLKAIFSLAAGADHVLCDPALPAQVPIVRIVDSVFIERMCEYVLAQTLWIHRDLHRYRQQQSNERWQPAFAKLSRERKVGVLGAGKIGSPVAQMLSSFGFDVVCWRYSDQPVNHVKTFHGQQQLGAFLSQSEILISLLPFTPDTESLINLQLLEQLPTGAGIINVGRGELLVESDLIAALDSNQIAVAILDVFRDEPLPDNHLFWRHPKVVVTPHVASLIDPVSGARALCREIAALDAGEVSDNIIDRQRGY